MTQSITLAARMISNNSISAQPASY